jgi:molybdopterin-binding protein
LMKLSARNVLEGEVLSIKKGPVSTEVDIETKGGERVVASITTASADSLKLEVGKKVYAVIKASNPKRRLKVTSDFYGLTFS